MKSKWQKKYCPKCKKKREVVWKFSRERCRTCNEPLDKDPLRAEILVFKSPFFGAITRTHGNN